MLTDHDKAVSEELRVDAKIFAKNPDKLIKLKEKQMKEAVQELDFETAAILRDEIIVLNNKFFVYGCYIKISLFLINSIIVAISSAD